MIKKSYSKTGRSCRVTFDVEADQSVKVAALCGDFNAWDTTSTPMKRRKDGKFSVTVSLSPGQPYRFRYLLDGAQWENDADADRHLPNPFGSNDSVIEL